MNKNSVDDFVFVELGTKNDKAHHGTLGEKEYPGSHGTHTPSYHTDTWSLWKSIFGEAWNKGAEEGAKTYYKETFKETKPPAPLDRSLSLSDFNFPNY